jgi:hypothetical protein
MIKLNYDGTSYDVKSNVNELTIAEYEKISKIDQDVDDFIDKWFKILTELGLPKSVIDDIDVDELLDIINELNLSEIDKVFQNEIEIDGYKYICQLKEDGTPKITGRIFKELEQAIKKDNYISIIMAILFKREDLTINEHYNEEHIEYKAKLFKNLNASMSIPYIFHIADKYVKNLQTL